MEKEKMKSLLNKKVFFSSAKEWLAVAIVLIFIIVFINGYDSSNYIYSAAVNENDGGFSFVLKTSQLEVHMCDKSGTEFKTLCFDDEITEGGTAVIWFDGCNYKVYFYRPHLCLTINNEGEIISEQEMDQNDVPECWEGWEKGQNSYTYEFESIIYCYNEESYFAKRFGGKERTFEITDSDGYLKIIWTQNQGMVCEKTEKSLNPDSETDE